MAYAGWELLAESAQTGAAAWGLVIVAGVIAALAAGLAFGVRGRRQWATTLILIFVGVAVDGLILGIVSIFIYFNR